MHTSSMKPASTEKHSEAAPRENLEAFTHPTNIPIGLKRSLHQHQAKLNAAHALMIPLQGKHKVPITADGYVRHDHTNSVSTIS